MKNKFVIFFLLHLFQFNKIVCQQNGDVRLNLYGNFYTNNGILEVFFTEVNEWVPVCHHQFNDGAAAAACRQIGYCRNINYLKAHRFHSNYSYTSVSCSEQRNYVDNGALHLLRCQGSLQKQNCSHGAVYLTCDSCFLIDKPYNGQIYLENYNSYIISSGILFLYFNDQWLPACAAEPFNQDVADTVCRQLGYTGAIENGFQQKKRSFSWNIGNIEYINKSFPCLKNYSNTLYKSSNCNNYNITCTFNETKKAQLSSGSKAECMYSATGPTNQVDHESKTFLILFVITLFVSVILFFVLGLIIVIKLKKCYTYPHRHRHQCQSQNYHSLDTCYGEI